MKHRRQLGVSVLEMVLVAALVVGLIGIAARNYNSVNSDQLTMHAVRQVRVLVQTVHSRFDDMPNFVGLSSQMLAEIVPAGALTFDKSKDKFVTPWGGGMSVSPYAFGGSPNMGFSVAIEQASLATCTSLVTALSREFSEISVGNETLKTNGNPLDYQPPVADIAKACSVRGRNAPIVAFRGI